MSEPRTHKWLAEDGGYTLCGIECRAKARVALDSDKVDCKQCLRLMAREVEMMIGGPLCMKCGKPMPADRKLAGWNTCQRCTGNALAALYGDHRR